MSGDNKWQQPEDAPPPLFTGEKEKNLVKQVNDELIEKIIGQTILYFPLSIEDTEYHPLYGEAIRKNFLPPVRVHALIQWNDYETQTGTFGADRTSTIEVRFHKRRLTEDQDLYVREGDFVQYDGSYYEIMELKEPRKLFGQDGQSFEIMATCKKAREGLFDGR